jgi:hypothetical protein
MRQGHPPPPSYPESISHYMDRCISGVRYVLDIAKKIQRYRVLKNAPVKKYQTYVLQNVLQDGEKNMPTPASICIRRYLRMPTLYRTRPLELQRHHRLRLLQSVSHRHKNF